MSQSVAVGQSSIVTINPYSNEVVREFSPMAHPAVDEPIEAAHQAFASWRATPVEERAALEASAARLMRRVVLTRIALEHAEQAS